MYGCSAFARLVNGWGMVRFSFGGMHQGIGLDSEKVYTYDQVFNEGIDRSLHNANAVIAEYT